MEVDGAAEDESSMDCITLATDGPSAEVAGGGGETLAGGKGLLLSLLGVGSSSAVVVVSTSSPSPFEALEGTVLAARLAETRRA